MKLTHSLILAAVMATACSGPSDQKTSSETCGLAPGALDTFISFGPGSFDKGKDPVYPEESPPLLCT